jgi:hypothetical protein
VAKGYHSLAHCFVNFSFFHDFVDCILVYNVSLLLIFIWMSM